MSEFSPPDLSPPTPKRSQIPDLAKKRFLRLPVWSWVIVAVVAVAGISAASQKDTKGDDEATVPSSTSENFSVPVTDMPTTTQRATTTSVDPALDADLMILIALSELETSQRENLIQAIEDDFILDRVDVFAIDVVDGTAETPGEVTLRIEGSSGYSSEEIQLDKSWELATATALLWELDGLLRNDAGKLKPSLAIVVDGRRFYASYELMVRLAERSIDRPTWFAEAASSQ